MSLLQVENLVVDFMTHHGKVRAVDGISFELEKGEFLGIVGESGSGKSVTAQAILGLLPDNAIWSASKIRFDEQNLQQLNRSKQKNLLGKELSMIFQDPCVALNPCFTVGDQLEEAIMVHSSLGVSERKQRAIELLKSVGLPAPEIQMKAYPHQLSGGMNQRVMIAMAISHHPKVLIADEPTTALDVTIQAQILDLLLHLSRQYQMSIILISHDLGVVSETCDRMLVMRLGQIVEQGKTEDILKNPKHSYTQMLLGCCKSRGK